MTVMRFGYSIDDKYTTFFHNIQHFYGIIPLPCLLRQLRVAGCHHQFPNAFRVSVKTPLTRSMEGEGVALCKPMAALANAEFAIG